MSGFLPMCVPNKVELDAEIGMSLIFSLMLVSLFLSVEISVNVEYCQSAFDCLN